MSNRKIPVRWKFRSNPLAQVLIYDLFASVPVPGPYPVSPPEMDELPEYWYVVERGTEVGIMADRWVLRRPRSSW